MSKTSTVIKIIKPDVSSIIDSISFFLIQRTVADSIKTEDKRSSTPKFLKLKKSDLVSNPAE